MERVDTVLERGSYGIRERGLRPAALIVVVAFHASVLLVSQSRTRSNDAARTSVWVDLDSRMRDDVDVNSAPERKSEQRSAQPAPSSRRQAPAALAPSLAPSAPATDWSLAGAISAQAAVEDLARREGYQPLGPREKAAEDGGEPPTVFTAPKHRFGDAEMDPLNYDIVWHNDRCYTELGKTVTPRVDARHGFPNLMKCRLIGIGKKPARGDLFEHLQRDRAAQQPP